MLSKILSSGLKGIDGYIINVEVDITNGLPAFDIVGLPNSSIRESKERVRTAIKNSGYEFPVKRITVNLAPANTKKGGSYFDLPIAVAILSCIGQISDEDVKDMVIIGELSLDGSIKPVSGILSMVYSASKLGIKKCIVPFENAKEAALIRDIDVIGLKSLKELVYVLKSKEFSPIKVDVDKFFKKSYNENDIDFSDVRGQESVKRALEIAAAGMHNILIIGPPGSGKTMMARRLPTILPDLTFDESIEITKIYSVSGFINDNNSLITTRPFRSPHHTISSSGLIGGGVIPKPGEVSLSHNGVLFLDEFPEFQKNILEELRQPMEDGQVSISRINGMITFPSNFMLVASMNPCPCGFYGYSDKCSCTQNEINRYIGKISGPLLDRIDLHVEASFVEYSSLNQNNSETSENIKNRVLKAQIIQRERYKNENIYFNSQLSAKQTEKYCKLGKKENDIIKMAFQKLNLSTRAYYKVIKMSRTIADLANSKTINTEHIIEAVQFRNLDRVQIF